MLKKLVRFSLSRTCGTSAGAYPCRPTAVTRQQRRYRHTAAEAQGAMTGTLPPAKGTGGATKIVLATATFIALWLHVAAFAETAFRPFDGEVHAWASAHSALLARSYARIGIIAVRGLPIGNNLPLGERPDAYIHWPPLYPMALSRVFLAAHESEAVARSFAFATSMLAVAALWFAARAAFDRLGASVATLAFATAPAFATFTTMVQGTMLSLALMLVALGYFLRATAGDAIQRRPALLGGAALAAAVMTSWEPALLSIGLLIVSVIRRRRHAWRLAALYLAACIASAAGVLACYLIAAPHMADELWRVLLYRAYGQVQDTRAVRDVHAFALAMQYNKGWSVAEIASGYWSQLRWGVGWVLAAAAACTLVWRNCRSNLNPTALTAVAGTGAVWLLWYLLMPTQAVDNEFEMMFAAPPLAFLVTALVIAVVRLGSSIGGSAAAAVFLAALLAPPLAVLAATSARLREPARSSGYVEFANSVREHTPPGAVVISPIASLVPTYYSERHTIRAVDSGAALQGVLERIGDSLPGAPVFVAAPGDMIDLDWVQRAGLTIVHRSPEATVVFVGVAAE